MALALHPARLRQALESAGDDDFVRSRTDRTRRDWALDVLAIALSMAAGIFIYIDGKNGEVTPSDLMLTVNLAILPIACILLLWRRRWPFGIAVAGAVLGMLGPSIALPTLIMTYAVAAYSRPAIGMLGITVMLLSVPVVTAFWTDLGTDGPDTPYLADLLLGMVATIAAGAWGMFAGARRHLMLSLEDRANRAESEQQMRVEQARQQERTRIAREMHDVLAHRMSLLSVHAGALEFRPDAPPEDVARAAGVIRATAHEALEELRTVIGVMRVADTTGAATSGDVSRTAGESDALPEAPQPTLDDVAHLIEEWRAAGARIELTVEPAVTGGVPTTVSRTAYRIVQEALTNAGKHAPGAKVTIAVGGQPGDTLTVSVVNAIGVVSPA
ncbi:MAG: hypothetical protein JHD16_18970, partial [Solirubrobacteraceae bacterium]|nr:hypothetical protein [Solirubrobacteraceae bacterium]